MQMTGSILNATGIFIGGVLGLMLGRQFSAAAQINLRKWIGLATVAVALHLLWMGLNGTFLQILKQLAVVILALTVGRIVGRLLGIQRAFNRLGQYATARMNTAGKDNANRFNDGFTVCALLFCAGPLGPVGAVQDGLLGYWLPLAVKTVMDGLATMGFVTLFGPGAILSALPVFVLQGSITQGAHALEPFLREHGLLNSVTAISGVLVFCVAFVLLELKKVPLADYLPSLAMAPFITWLWH